MFPLPFPYCKALPFLCLLIATDPLPTSLSGRLSPSLPTPSSKFPASWPPISLHGAALILFSYFFPAISPPWEAGDDKVATGNWPQICLPQHSMTPLPLPLTPPPPIASIPCGSLSHLELGPEFPSPPCVSRCEQGRPV